MWFPVVSLIFTILQTILLSIWRYVFFLYPRTLVVLRSEAIVIYLYRNRYHHWCAICRSAFTLSRNFFSRDKPINFTGTRTYSFNFILTTDTTYRKKLQNIQHITFFFKTLLQTGVNKSFLFFVENDKTMKYMNSHHHQKRNGSADNTQPRKCIKDNAKNGHHLWHTSDKI